MFFLSLFSHVEIYVVFIEQPIKMNLLKIVTGRLTGKGVSESFYWDLKHDTIFHLINKQTGKVWPKFIHSIFPFSDLKGCLFSDAISEYKG